MKDRDAVVGDYAHWHVKTPTWTSSAHRPSRVVQTAVGNWRVLYYSDPPGIVIERIVNRAILSAL